MVGTGDREGVGIATATKRLSVSGDRDQGTLDCSWASATARPLRRNFEKARILILQVIKTVGLILAVLVQPPTPAGNSVSHLSKSHESVSGRHHFPEGACRG